VTRFNQTAPEYSGPSRSNREDDCGQRRLRGWSYAWTWPRTAGDRAFRVASPRL